MVAVQVRKDRAKGGVEKAKERQEARQQRCMDIKAQVGLLLAAIRKLEVDNEARFTKRLREADALDDQVLKNFDAKIANAKAAAAALASIPTGSTDAQQTSAPPPPPADNADKHMQELEVLRTRVSTLTGQLTEATRRTSQFEVHVEEVSLCDLPDLEEPKDDKATALAAIFGTLEHWDEAGAAQPFDWEALAAATQGIQNPVACFKDILGQKWNLWFKEGDPHPSAVVPRHVAHLAYKNLQRLQTQICKMEIPADARKRAEASFEAIRESSQRIRSA